MQHEAHPAAMIFPMLDGEPFERLKADILEHGQRDDIVFLDGKILDGRNRYKACLELGIDPYTCELDECDDPVAYVISCNLHRRHLTKAQWAAIAVEYIPLLAEQAAARKTEGQKAGGQIGGRGNKKPSGKKLSKGLDDGKATAHAAKLTNTNSTYVQAAKKLKAEAPEVFEEMKSGKLSVPQAMRKANGKPEPTGERKKPKAKAESNVIGDTIKQLSLDVDCAIEALEDFQIAAIIIGLRLHLDKICKERGI